MNKKVKNSPKNYFDQLSGACSTPKSWSKYTTAMPHKVPEVNYILNPNLKLQVNAKVLVSLSIFVSQILNAKTGNLFVIDLELLTSANLANTVHTTNGSYPFEVQLKMHGPTCPSGSSQIQCYMNVSV